MCVLHKAKEVSRLLSASPREGWGEGTPPDGIRGAHSRMYTRTFAHTHLYSRYRGSRTSEKEEEKKDEEGDDISRTPRAIGAVVKY